MSTTRSGLILPRQRAPAFSTKGVFQGSIESFSSDRYEGKWLVLFFYPFDYTFVCPTELVAFSSAAKRFEELGAQVVAVSCDSVHVHFSWMSVPQAEGGVGMLNFPLLADNTKRMSRDYGVLVEDADDELCGASLRALFIIDPKFVVRSVVVNDEAVGRSVEETIRLIQAFQYADEHGETCPGRVWNNDQNTPKRENDIPEKVEIEAKNKQGTVTVRREIKIDATPPGKTTPEQNSDDDLLVPVKGAAPCSGCRSC